MENSWPGLGIKELSDTGDVNALDLPSIRVGGQLGITRGLT